MYSSLTPLIRTEERNAKSALYVTVDLLYEVLRTRECRLFLGYDRSAPCQPATQGAGSLHKIVVSNNTGPTLDQP